VHGCDERLFAKVTAGLFWEGYGIRRAVVAVLEWVIGGDE
jgi:hypothetical protein